MKADFALISGAAACLVVIPLAVLFWSGTPLGSAKALNETPTQDTSPVILPADEGTSGQTSSAASPTEAENSGAKADLTGLTLTSFRILDEDTGRVNEVAALDYIAGAIAAELPASFESEAMTAQGVAAYTNAVYLARLRRQSPEDGLKGADFSANPGKLSGYLTKDGMKSCWGDHYEEYYAKVLAAAETAQKHLLFYEGQPILAAYHAISAGYTTEDSGNVWLASLPYLTGADSSWDKGANGFESSVTLTKEQFRSLLTKAGAKPDGQPSRWFAILSRSKAGYVTRVSAGDLPMTGQEFRNLLGLRSSSFTYEWEDGGANITFHVKGYGHGVGLSQYGAEYLAENGEGYAAILAHYYPGTELITT